MHYMRMSTLSTYAAIPSYINCHWGERDHTHMNGIQSCPLSLSSSSFGGDGDHGHGGGDVVHHHYILQTSVEKLARVRAALPLPPSDCASAICIINSNMFSHCAFNMLTVHDINGCTRAVHRVRARM